MCAPEPSAHEVTHASRDARLRLRRLAEDWRREERWLCEQFGGEVAPQSIRARQIKDTQAIEPTKEIYECFAAYDGSSYSNPFDFDDFSVDYAFALEAAQEAKP